MCVCERDERVGIGAGFGEGETREYGTALTFRADKVCAARTIRMRDALKARVRAVEER